MTARPTAAMFLADIRCNAVPVTVWWGSVPHSSRWGSAPHAECDSALKDKRKQARETEKSEMDVGEEEKQFLGAAFSAA